jgi:hypothetical protein
MMRLLRWVSLLSMVLLFGSAYAQTTPATSSTRQRIPSPMLSSSGKFSVGCQTEQRESYRWPVLKFVENVVENFEASFVPVGSTEFPLYVVLGTSTDEKDTHVVRRTLTVSNAFSQLAIGIPNPDVVDLELLRVAIVEALLREECRTRTGAYATFAWPEWFVRGMTYASFGNVWKAQAYEIVLKDLEAGSLPTLDALFNDKSLKISNETAAFFAMWVMQARSNKSRYQTISAPWAPEHFVGTPLSEQKEAEWHQWILGLQDKVFVPGALTARYFDRWQAELVAPTSREEVIRITDYLTRNVIGRPQLFRDLTVLYLEAYVAWLQKGDEGYQPLRKKADEAALILKEHLTRNSILVDEALTPATEQEEWQRPYETK